jgi:hypothetical protein
MHGCMISSEYFTSEIWRTWKCRAEEKIKWSEKVTNEQVLEHILVYASK